MQLLVSVRSAAEALAALDGAADIIDAKEPTNGSLGPVAPAALADIVAHVPPGHPVSVALGDLTSIGQVHAAIGAILLPRRPGPTFVKIGFAGERGIAAVSALIASACEAVSALPAQPRVVAVAYADADQVDAPDPWEICEAAQRGGAAGVLLDTAVKTNATLTALMAARDLSEWVALAHLHELTAGLAGSLRLEDLEVVGATGADIVGIRGAACEGGRLGTVSAARVAELAATLRTVQIATSGETPQPRPHSGPHDVT